MLEVGEGFVGVGHFDGVFALGHGLAFAAIGGHQFLGEALEHGPAGFTTISNDNWRDAQQAEIEASGLAPTNDLEAAILVMLDPGSYTAVLKGTNETSGLALVEVYELDQILTSNVVNISTRASVGVTNDVCIGGFILGEGDNANILVRGIGPSLAGGGIGNALFDPTLALYDSNGILLVSNDDCESSTLPPTNPVESCIETRLSAGAYTAILAGKNGCTGIGLIEIYNLQ